MKRPVQVSMTISFNTNCGQVTHGFMLGVWFTSILSNVNEVDLILAVQTAKSGFVTLTSDQMRAIGNVDGVLGMQFVDS
jgi:hypothetical protein